ncbi:hypothetical protein LCGC14_0502800 [marine sediment metagenome]|uniref:adenylyl-sulfate kinase n=1 Tax=marine sediment metagenome TaxID=412755 RepID=A0A0F9SLY4_9ZZZZ
MEILFIGGKMKGHCYWLTGLPCSGKTTIINELGAILNGASVQHHILDGDVFRKNITNHLSFSNEDRRRNLLIAANIAKILILHDIIVLCAFISPFVSVRKEVEKIIGEENYTEIYIEASRETCIKRDVKGMWKKALNGDLHAFTGVGSVYEMPLNSITINTEKKKVFESVSELKKIIEGSGKSWVPTYQI